MSGSLTFFIGLLESGPSAAVSLEDVEGEHGDFLRSCQRLGFVSREPGMHPIPSCPHCGEGVPYRIADRFLCNHCRSGIDSRHLLLWPLDIEVFLRWLAKTLKLRGGVRRIEEQLWQLGTLVSSDSPCECFYCKAGPLSDAARDRLAAYRRAIVLYGLSRSATEHVAHPSVSLLEVLRLGRNLTILHPSQFLRTDRTIRFDPKAGAIWAGQELLGEVPLHSREHAFLACLAEQQDAFVPYADIKRCVLEMTGSRDETEEATFCQGLKSRIKKKWIPQLDQLIVTTNKGEGYRLRAVIPSPT